MDLWTVPFRQCVWGRPLWQKGRSCRFLEGEAFRGMGLNAPAAVAPALCCPDGYTGGWELICGTNMTACLPQGDTLSALYCILPQVPYMNSKGLWKLCHNVFRISMPQQKKSQVGVCVALWLRPWRFDKTTERIFLIQFLLCSSVLLCALFHFDGGEFLSVPFWRLSAFMHIEKSTI